MSTNTYVNVLGLKDTNVVASKYFSAALTETQLTSVDLHGKIMYYMSSFFMLTRCFGSTVKILFCVNAELV